MEILYKDKAITQADLKSLETYLDRLFASLNIDVSFTRHFLDRVNDARNIKQITFGELVRIFKQTYKKWGKRISQMGSNIEAVLKDLSTNINVPFVLNWNDREKELELIAKTVMRKNNFQTSNDVLTIEKKSKLVKKIIESNLVGGGRTIFDYLLYEPTGKDLEIATEISKLKNDRRYLYRGMSRAEYRVLEKEGKVTSKGDGNTRKGISGSYVSTDIQLAGRFAYRAYQDKKGGYLLTLDRRKLPDLNQADEGNYWTAYIPKQAIVDTFILQK
jgi:hypothetical protein